MDLIYVDGALTVLQGQLSRLSDLPIPQFPNLTASLNGSMIQASGK